MRHTLSYLLGIEDECLVETLAGRLSAAPRTRSAPSPHPNALWPQSSGRVREDQRPGGPGRPVAALAAAPVSGGHSSNCSNSRSRPIPPPPALPDVLCRRLYRIAVGWARQQGVPPGELEDCALEFVARMLVAAPARWEGLAQGAEPDGFAAWIHRCAVNHARTYRRRSRARQRVLAALTSGAAPENAPDADPALSPARPALASAADPAPAAVLRCEFWRRVAPLFRQLPPDQAALAWSCWVDGMSAQDVAASLPGARRSPNAVRLCLSRTRRRLRGMLARQAVTEEDLRGYLLPR